jgi:hypothetical protein
MLSGWARAGKDTVAEHLCSAHGYRRMAFADPLKEAVAAEAGIPLSVFHSDAKNQPMQGGQTPRDLLIEHARRARNVDPDVYSRVIAANILDECLEDVVISDWRLRREYEYMRNNFPATEILRVRIERPGLQTHNDVTEHELDSDCMDIRIINDGDIQTLYQQMDDVLSQSS